jgi:hypothetical protein
MNNIEGVFMTTFILLYSFQYDETLIYYDKDRIKYITFNFFYLIWFLKLLNVNSY